MLQAFRPSKPLLVRSGFVVFTSAPDGRLCMPGISYKLLHAAAGTRIRVASQDARFVNENGMLRRICVYLLNLMARV